MQAAQKALQAEQWQEALKNLNEAEAKVGPYTVRQEDHLRFQGLRGVQARQVQGGRDGLRGRHGHRPIHAGGNRQDHQPALPRGCPESAVREGDRVRQAGRRLAERKAGRSEHHGAALLPAEGLQEHRCMGGQGIGRVQEGRRGAEGEHLPVQAAVRLGCGRYRGHGSAAHGADQAHQQDAILEHAVAPRAAG